MSTSGSFVPAAVPECPYPVTQTWAGAEALRAAGALLENCVVTVPGPVLGCPGNQSPTFITLQPTGPSQFADEALVATTAWGAATAWQGTYDFPTQRLTELQDDWGNHVKDVDAGVDNVVNFPWHLRGTDLRDNYSEDTTGWCTYTAGVAVDNTTRQATLDFTAFTTGDSFRENTVVDRFDLAFTGAGSVKTVTGNTMTGDTDGDNTVTDLLISATAGTITLDSSAFWNDSGATAWTFGGTGSVTVRGNRFQSNVADQFFKTSAASFFSQRADWENGKWKDIGGAGTTSFNVGKLNNGAVFRDAGATGGLNLIYTDLSASTTTDGFALIRQEATSTATVSFTDCKISGDYRLSLANTGSVNITQSTFREGATAAVQALFANSALVTIDGSTLVGGDTSTQMPQLSLSGSGVYTLNGVDMTEGKLLVLAAQAAAITFTDTEVVGYKFQFAKTAGATTIFDSKFIGQTVASLIDFDALGTGTITMDTTIVQNKLGAPNNQFSLAGSGAWQTNQCQILAVALAGPAPAGYQSSAASTGGVNMFGGIYQECAVVQSGSGLVTMEANNLSQSRVTAAGSGPITVTTVYGVVVVQSAVASTRGTSVSGTTASAGTITQNGTGGAGVDSISNGVLGGLINLNNTAATAGG